MVFFLKYKVKNKRTHSALLLVSSRVTFSPCVWPTTALRQWISCSRRGPSWTALPYSVLTSSLAESYPAIKWKAGRTPGGSRSRRLRERCLSEGHSCVLFVLFLLCVSHAGSSLLWRLFSSWGERGLLFILEHSSRAHRFWPGGSWGTALACCLSSCGTPA